MSIELSTRGTVSEIYLLIMWNVLTVILLVTLPASPAVTLTEAALPNGKFILHTFFKIKKYKILSSLIETA